MPFRLAIEDGRFVQTLEVRTGRLTVGRSRPSHLVLASPGLARRHAVFRQVGERVEVEDLGSRVGVRLRGERVTKAWLQVGDTVQVGWARITLVDVTAAALVASAAQAPASDLPAAPATSIPGATPDAAASHADAPAAIATGTGAAAVPAKVVERPPAPRPARPHHDDFGDVAYRALRRSPCLVASAALHGAACLVLQMLGLWSVTPPREAEVVVALAQGREQVALEEERAEPMPHDLEADLVRPEPEQPADDRPEATAEDDDDLQESLPIAPADLPVGFEAADARATVGLAPTTTLSGESAQEFGKDDAGRANRSAAALVAGDTLGGAILRGVRLRTSRDNVLVVRGTYDHGERILEGWGLDHGWLRPEDLHRFALKPAVRAVFWNCSGESATPQALRHLEEWVRGGGWLFTSDWGVEMIVGRAFPGRLAPLRQGRQTLMTPEETVTFEVAAPEHSLLRGLPPSQQTSQWWLEESSIPFRIEDAAQVEVLIRSKDLERLHGSGLVAVTFEHGRGRVVHAIGHMFQREGNLRGAYAMQRLLLNFLHGALRR